jgi:hypothetical protein
LFVSVKDSDKGAITAPVRALCELGFKVIATGGTASWLDSQGIAVSQVNKVAQGRPHIVDRIKDGGRRHHLQHHRGLAEPQGLGLDPRLGPDGEGSLLHHGGLERGGGSGDRGPRGAQP